MKGMMAMYGLLDRKRYSLVAGVMLGVWVMLPITGWAAGEPWSQKADCASCHVAEGGAMLVGESVHGDLPCATCHDDDAVLANVHKEIDASSKMPTKLKKAKIDAVTCLACHGEVSAGLTAVEDPGRPTEASQPDASRKAADSTDDDLGMDALAALTDDSRALVDGDGTVVNPHDLPDVKDHEGIGCTDCHKVHAEDDPAKRAAKACAACHHANVFECYTCHA